MTSWLYWSDWFHPDSLPLRSDRTLNATSGWARIISWSGWVGSDLKGNLWLTALLWCLHRGSKWCHIVPPASRQKEEPGLLLLGVWRSQNGSSGPPPADERQGQGLGEPGHRRVGWSPRGPGPRGHGQGQNRAEGNHRGCLSLYLLCADPEFSLAVTRSRCYSWGTWQAASRRNYWRRPSVSLASWSEWRNSKITPSSTLRKETVQWRYGEGEKPVTSDGQLLAV